MNNELISIIIPIYNVEQYLEQCLDSVKKQTYSNIEIICVNDGSTDNSLSIIKKYKEKDTRIEIIDRPNKGLLASRLDGVKIAKGNYILFVDSDDWIEENMVEVLYNKLKQYNVDLVRCGYFINEKDITGTMEVSKQEMHLKKQSFEPTLYDLVYFSYKCNSAWREMIKKDKLKDIDNIDTTISLGEDIVLNLNIYPNIESILFIPDRLYHYRMNPNSITRKKDVNSIKKNIKSSTKAFCKLYESVKKFNIENIQKYENIALFRMIEDNVDNFINLIYKRETNETLTEFINLEQFELVREKLKFEQLRKIKTKNNFIINAIYKKNIKIIKLYAFTWYKLKNNIKELIKRK